MRSVGRPTSENERILGPILGLRQGETENAEVCMAILGLP